MPVIPTLEQIQPLVEGGNAESIYAVLPGILRAEVMEILVLFLVNHISQGPMWSRELRRFSNMTIFKVAMIPPNWNLNLKSFKIRYCDLFSSAFAILLFLNNFEESEDVGLFFLD